MAAHLPVKHPQVHFFGLVQSIPISGGDVNPQEPDRTRTENQEQEAYYCRSGLGSRARVWRDICMRVKAE